jgi:phosphopantothenoylcysteine synthetase/decarboxylase
VTEHQLSSRVLYLVVCAAPPAQHIGEVVTLLMDEGWSVCVIPTPQAAGWVDAAALAEQTGYPVRHDYRQLGDTKSLPPANAVVVVPATFNTINKWSSGISDNYALGILNEAVGLDLPIICAPYAKSTLAAHPAFSASLKKLADYGTTILANEAIRVGRVPTEPEAALAVDWRPITEALDPPPTR